MLGEVWPGRASPVARTLADRDTAWLLNPTAGADLGAPYAAPAHDVPFASLLERDPRPLRIALVEHLAPWPSGPDALAAVRHTARLCESLGHHVEPATLPVDLPCFLDQVFDIIGPSSRHYLQVLGAMRGTPVSV